MIERVLAGLVLAVCALLMLRLLLDSRRRARFDAAMRRVGLAARRGALSIWHWRSQRRAAQREAADAIERARRAGRDPGDPGDGEWDGNVYKPKSFKRPRKPH